MRILIAGGAGEIGNYLARAYLAQGHQLVIFDIQKFSTRDLPDHQIKIFTGNLTDCALVEEAVQNVDVVINLAWSFIDCPKTIFCEDIAGHINLLESASLAKVKHFIYTSTATVYGKPKMAPVTEDHPCILDKARKPLYALGKFTAEQLCHIYRADKGLPVTILRFWWAFGDTIGGKHLRELIRAALKGEPLKVVAGAGGTFVTLEDLAAFVLAAPGRSETADSVYNIGSLFLTWSEIAEMIIADSGSDSCLEERDGSSWEGKAFLNEKWRLNWDKARRQVGFRPSGNEQVTRQSFRQALGRCIASVQASEHDE